MADASADRAELILEVRDAISPNVSKIAAALDKANVAMGGSDKAVNKLDKSFGSFVGVLNDVTKSASGGAASVDKLGKSTTTAARGISAEWKQAAASAQQYATELARINAMNLRTDASGVVRTSGGQFGPSVARQTAATEGYIEATQRANAALAREAATYAQLSEATGISSAALRENLSLQQAQAALATRQRAELVPGNPVIAPTPAARPASTIGPTVSSGSSAAIRAVGNEASAATPKVGRFAAAMSVLESSSNSTRYAAFAVSQQLAHVGAGLLALPVLSAVVSASFDRDFANVARATATATGGSEVNLSKLRASLVGLSEQIPVSFKDLTNIATLGAQLGVRGTTGLTSFTKTVAELSATTNLTSDAAGTMLGRFLAVNAINTKQFDKLASSVLNVGVNSAATESQISAIATQIVGIGKIAGFTSPQIIGLSGAIASVSSNGAALARGAVTRFITVLQQGVETGGPALEAFAKTSGITSAQVQRDWGTSAFAGDFQKFFKGLSEQGGQANQTLIQMGITSVRDIPLFLQLANGWKTLNRSMTDAQQGWNNTAIIAVHYQKINDTLVSKVKELGNTFLAAFDSMGRDGAGALGLLVDGVSGLVRGFANLMSIPIVQLFATAALTAGVFAGGIALLGSGILKLYAGLQAARVVMTAFREATLAFVGADAAATAANSAQAASVAALSTEYTVATGRARLLNVAMNGLVVGLAAGIGVGAASALNNFTNSTDGAHASLKKLTAEYKESGIAGLNMDKALRSNNSGFKLFVPQVDKANKGLADLGKNFGINFQAGNAWFHSLTGIGDSTFGNIKNLDSLLAKLVKGGNAGEANKIFLQLAAGFKQSDGNIKDLTGSLPQYTAAVQAAAKGADTYSNALDKQNKSLIENNTMFQAVSGMTAKQFSQYTDAVGKSISPLTDFNSVVGQVQQSLQAQAQAQADLAGGNAKASDYYDGQSVSLDQYSSALQANAGVAQTWLSNIQTIASTYGTTVANQFIQAGYSVTNASILQQLIDATPEQAQRYIDATTAAQTEAAQAAGTALITAGQLVTANGGQIGADTAAQIGAQLLAGFSPADIMKEFNLQFNTSPAQPQVDTQPASQALLDWITRHTNFSISGHAQLDTSPATNDINNWYRANDGRHITVYQDVVTGHVSNTGTFAGGNAVGFTGGFYNGRKFMYDTGGYTGNGGKYSPAGIVHRGEFVFNKEATNAYGVPYLMNMMRGFRGARGQGYVGGGPVGLGTVSQGVPVVALDAGTLAAIGQALYVQLNLDGKMLTASNNANNVNASNRREN